MTKNKSILVLGAKGMLGHVVYDYLFKQVNCSVFGTNKNGDDKYLEFNALHPFSSFKKISKLLPRFDYVVNCIGIIKELNDSDLQTKINAIFPIELEKLQSKYFSNLIHISSDAVFSSLSSKVNELSIPNPDDDYGISKLRGEVYGINSITIRTSIIGKDPFHHRGLLEWALKQKENIKGLINVSWSGGTNIQVADFIFNIICNFDYFRDISPIYHFAPLGPISKFDLLSSWLRINNKTTKVTKYKSDRITRQLTSLYTNKYKMNNITTDIDSALLSLKLFEDKYYAN